jgi:hypothetical protein
VELNVAARWQQLGVFKYTIIMIDVRVDGSGTGVHVYTRDGQEMLCHGINSGSKTSIMPSMTTTMISVLVHCQ